MDESSFLESIQATPGDEAPRLVYADWLEERGDSRAEFLRLQQILATTLDRLQHVRPTLDPDWIQKVEIRRNVVLHSYPGDRTLAMIHLLRNNGCLDLLTARSILSQLPAIIFSNQTLERAESLRQEFSAVESVQVTIEPLDWLLTDRSGRDHSAILE